MVAEAQMNFFRVISPGEAARREQTVGLSGRRPDNTGDQLLEVYLEQGYPFEFEVSQKEDIYLLIPGEALDVMCYDARARAKFKTRENIITQTPTFKFLSMATDGQYSNLDLLTKIVGGSVLDLSKHMSDIEHIGLNQLELKQSLALAYWQKEKYYTWYPDSLRKLLEADHELNLGLASQLNRPDLAQFLPNIDERITEEQEKSKKNIAQLSDTRQYLGVEPLSSERLKEIISNLADKTDSFLTAN